MQARGAAGPYQQAGGGRRPATSVASLDQAYAQLGLTRKASDAEIKKAYRKLVSQYHPDKLVSRGLPEEMMEMAKTRVRDINTAYDRIKQARGFK
jgi:DnaJ like chaperone protein